MNNTVWEKLKELGLKGAAQSYAALQEDPTLLSGMGVDELMLCSYWMQKPISAPLIARKSC